MRVLTTAGEVELDRRLRERARRMKSGEETRSPAEFKASLEDLGTPVDSKLIEKAVREYGHLGLRALDVAAAWSLGRRAPILPRRSVANVRPRRRRVAGRTARARSPGRPRPDDDPSPSDRLAAARAALDQHARALYDADQRLRAELDALGYRQCSSCYRELPPDEFTRKSYRCRACEAERQRERRRRQREAAA